MALTHGDLARKLERIGIVDNPVQNGVSNRAVLVRTETGIPFGGRILRAEDRGAR